MATAKSRIRIKHKLIQEALEYSPEKINSFTSKLTKDLADLKRVFAGLAGKVGDLTIYAVQDNTVKAKELLNKIVEVKRYSEKAYDQYYTIVDMYDYTDMPSNVRALEKLVDELDDITTNLKNLENALDNIIDAAKDFSKFSS